MFLRKVVDSWNVVKISPTLTTICSNTFFFPFFFLFYSCVDDATIVGSGISWYEVGVDGITSSSNDSVALDVIIAKPKIHTPHC